MLRIGFIGWRGMVGSVLMGRMKEEGDFQGFEATFFTTSNIGGDGPDVGLEIPPLQDAYDIDLLSSHDIIITCQGGGYTKEAYAVLRKKGWKGYWIDSASTLRMNDDSIIVLDPVNRSVIDDGLSSGIKDYVGPVRASFCRSRGVDFFHDLSGGFRSRGKQYERIDCPDGFYRCSVKDLSG